MAFDTQEPNHIDAMRALHDSIVNNDAIPDVGHILDRHLPSQAHKDLLQTAAMREAQMTHEGGETSSFDDSLLGNATHLITSLPERTASRLSSLLSSEDPHDVAGAVKFLGETARERQQRMEEDAMGAVSVEPNQLKRSVRELTSLDAPRDESIGTTASDIALGFVPGVGTAQAMRDFERSRREGSGLGMAMAGIGMIPEVGGVLKVGEKAGEGLTDLARKYLDFDPRFDTRVLEQERLRNIRPIIEETTTTKIPTVSLSQYEGYPFITSMADRTRAGGLLTAINDVRFNRPVYLQGGQGYMFDPHNTLWAAAQVPARKSLELAQAVYGATGKAPLFMPWRMAPSASDFAKMTGETMLSYADASITNKNVRKSIDSRMKKIIPDWAGLGSDKAIEQYRNAPTVKRHAIHQMLDRDFREKGGLGLGEARIAISDPSQLVAPDAYLQNVGQFDVKGKILPSDHPSYAMSIPGSGLGALSRSHSVFELMPEYAAQRGIADVTKPERTHIRTLEMKPYTGLITGDLLKSLGY
jgi:hypothetical protein